MDPFLRAFVFVYRYCIISYDIVEFFIRSIFVYLDTLYRFFVPRPLNSVRGEVALVTGAGNGIGRCLSTQLAALGATVVCVDVDERANRETVRIIRDTGATAFSYICDVANRESVKNLHKKVISEVGDVTLLFNNAGVRFVKPFLNHKAEQIERIVNINLLGQMWMLRAFLPRMVRQDRGSIVALSGMVGYVGYPNMIPFSATKFAVRGMMEGLYLELRQEHPNHNLHLMTVAPFIVDTGMVKGSVIRIPGLFNVVSGEKAAEIIIANMRRREAVVFIPGIYYYINNLMRVLPLRIQLLLSDFIDMGIEISYDE